MTAAPPPTSAAVSASAPAHTRKATKQHSDVGLLNLRTAFILVLALAIAATAGTVAGLAAANAVTEHRVLGGVLAGIAAGGTTLLTVANSLNGLISRDP